MGELTEETAKTQDPSTDPPPLRSVPQERLAEILEAHRRQMASDGREGELADLQGADLRGVDLSGADLRRANFRGSDIRNGNLRGANLQEANFWKGNHSPVQVQR